MLLVDFAQQKQSGIACDVATGEIGLNLVAIKSVFRRPFWITAVGADFVCRYLKLSYFQPILFIPYEKSGLTLSDCQGFTAPLPSKPNEIQNLFRDWKIACLSRQFTWDPESR